MFLVFEGLDGAGKSTLIERTQDWLKKLGREVLVSREPGGPPLAEELRDLLLRFPEDPPTSSCELLMYVASRNQHVEKWLRPALASGRDVLCDRFSSSSLAFQCGGRGVARDQVEWLNQFATQGLMPDLEILVDVSVAVSQERLQRRNQRDRLELEAAAFHQRVRDFYLNLVQENPARWLVLDGDASLEKSLALLQARVREFL